MAKPSRHIVITGAGTGIGRAIALRLAAKGVSLSLVARNVERLDATAALARKSGAQVATFACDIRRKKQVDTTLDAAAAKFGPVFALVANSGIGGPNIPDSKDRFDDLVATNLGGTYYSLRAAQRHLAPGPDARHLVVMSSILARIGVPGYAGYCASKAGLLGLVRSLAVELAQQNVQVNAVCPGWVNTEMAHAGLADMARAMNVSADEARRIAMQAVPLGRMSEPEDVAGLVTWLISTDARGVTGQALDINGGAFMS
jgi:NAD(P)-dependent dehydrogenase (short-subunit alcohol dehydrogenase family)